MEVWKDIKDYEGYYQISNLGRVKSLNRLVNNHSGFKKNIKEKILKNSISKTGYYVVDLKINCIRKTFKVHRLIAIHFIPKIIGKDYVNHINGIKIDNSIINLEWCTISENNKHAEKMGLKNDKGYNHVKSKLTEVTLLEVINSNDKIKDIAFKYNVSYSTIYKAKKNITYQNKQY